MPAPTINTTTSVLSFTKGRHGVYQPYASDTPTSWACTGLPDGITINTSTGRIAGTPTETGVFNCPLTATNGTGTSSPVVLTIGVAAGNFQAQLDASVEINVDLRSGAVSIPGAQVVTDADNASLPRGVPILNVKESEKFLAAVGFTKDGTLLDIGLSVLNIGFKEYEPETLHAINDGTFQTAGSETTTRYKTILDLTDTDLDTLLSNYEGDDSTHLDVLAEIEYLTVYNPGSGALTLTRKSRTFVMRFERGIQQN